MAVAVAVVNLTGANSEGSGACDIGNGSNGNGDGWGKRMQDKFPNIKYELTSNGIVKEERYISNNRVVKIDKNKDGESVGFQKKNNISACNGSSNNCVNNEGNDGNF